jgi:hypothetical protein
MTEAHSSIWNESFAVAYWFSIYCLIISSATLPTVAQKYPCSTGAVPNAQCCARLTRQQQVYAILLADIFPLTIVIPLASQPWRISSRNRLDILPPSILYRYFVAVLLCRKLYHVVAFIVRLKAYTA